jgi:hypothetical protein
LASPEISVMPAIFIKCLPKLYLRGFRGPITILTPVTCQNLGTVCQHHAMPSVRMGSEKHKLHCKQASMWTVVRTGSHPKDYSLQQTGNLHRRHGDLMPSCWIKAVLFRHVHRSGPESLCLNVFVADPWHVNKSPEYFRFFRHIAEVFFFFRSLLYEASGDWPYLSDWTFQTEVEVQGGPSPSFSSLPVRCACPYHV